MKKFIYAALSFAPVLALAQNNAGTVVTTFTTWANGARTIANTLIPVMFALVIIFFLWGIVQFFRAQASGDPKAKDNAKTLLIWGVVAIAVAFTIFGLVNWLAGAVGVSPTSTPPTTPQF